MAATQVSSLCMLSFSVYLFVWTLLVGSDQKDHFAKARAIKQDFLKVSKPLNNKTEFYNCDKVNLVAHVYFYFISV